MKPKTKTQADDRKVIRTPFGGTVTAPSYYGPSLALASHDKYGVSIPFKPAEEVAFGVVFEIGEQTAVAETAIAIPFTAFSNGDYEEDEATAFIDDYLGGDCNVLSVYRIA